MKPTDEDHNGGRDRRLEVLMACAGKNICSSPSLRHRFFVMAPQIYTSPLCFVMTVSPSCTGTDLAP